MSRDMEGKSAEELRAAARRARDDAEESFRRSDTDGFLSQWASQISARLYERQADILDAGGLAEFWGLYTTDGERVPAKIVTGQWGTSWLIRGGEETYGRAFVPTGEKSRVQKKLGLVERREMAPARAKIMSNGKSTGLSGAANAFVGTVRTGDLWGTDATPIEEAK